MKPNNTTPRIRGSLLALTLIAACSTTPVSTPGGNGPPDLANVIPADLAPPDPGLKARCWANVVEKTAQSVGEFHYAWQLRPGTTTWVFLFCRASHGNFSVDFGGFDGDQKTALIPVKNVVSQIGLNGVPGAEFNNTLLGEHDRNQGRATNDGLPDQLYWVGIGPPATGWQTGQTLRVDWSAQQFELDGIRRPGSFGKYCGSEHIDIPVKDEPIPKYTVEFPCR